MSSEDFPETESSLQGNKKTVGLRLLEPEGTSKEVSTVAESDGKVQKAPSQRIQKEGMPETGKKGIQQEGEINIELRQLEDPGK